MTPLESNAKFRAYVINLDGRPDRLEAARREFLELGLPFTRISAVDAKLMNIHGDSFVKPAVAACWASHLSVFKEMVESNIKCALICEDDIDFGRLNVNQLVETMSRLELDVLQIGFLHGTIGRKVDLFGRNLLHSILYVLKILNRLGMSPRRFSNSPQIEEVSLRHPWLVPNDFRFGTHCYLISLEAATKILRIGGSQFLAADDFFVALAKMRYFRIHRLLKSRCGQTNSPSSILGFK